ncbi:MAG: pyridoxal-phosphate dependent enzyme [Candidatus Natronoplasma sp.]
MPLRCTECELAYTDKFRLRCDCGAPLIIENEFTRSFEEILERDRQDMRRYSGFLPVDDQYAPDLVPPMVPNVEKKIGGLKVVFKLEYMMPSGSFKDRGTYTTVAKLKEESIDEVSLDSSGNAAISLALYGKSEEIKTQIFIPEDIEEGKKRILKKLASEVHEISGTRMEVHERAIGFEDARYVSHWYNPFFLEGTKISAYEISEIQKVDRVLVPTGSGTLFLGMHKGFSELSSFGVVDKIPQMIAVEAKGYESLREISGKKSELSSGVEIIEPPRNDQMIGVLEETDGFSISIDDDKIESAEEELLSMGFLVETTSAMAYAGFLDLLEKEEFDEEETVLIPLTGSGLKSV